MQALYQTVRSTGATNIVVATGKDYGSHLDGVPLLTGSNITYAIHPYANDISPGGDPNAWNAGDWDNRFGYLAKKAPVTATEFGRLACNSTTTYDQGILDYFRTTGVGYTSWAWYIGGCNFPSLINNADGTCVEYGCAVQRDLKGLAAGTLTMTQANYAP